MVYKETLRMGGVDVNEVGRIKRKEPEWRARKKLYKLEE